MQLEYSGEFEDIRFVLRYFSKDAVFSRISSGIRLVADDGTYEGLDDVLDVLYRRYEPEHRDKKIKEAKRLRGSPEPRKVEINICNLISFHRLYRLMLVEGNLKNKGFIDQMTALISGSVRIDSDLQLLDIQVGEIVGIEDAPGLDKLYSEDVMARDRIRVLSGLREHVSRESMMGGKFLFVTNMKPAKFKGLVSEGMILCTRDEDGRVEPIRLPDEVENGTRLGLEGYEGLVEEYVPAKVDMRKSSYDNALKSFRVEEHFLTFKGTRVVCNGRHIRTSTANGPVS